MPGEQTKTIDIDIDVGKAIEAARLGFDETPNAILRRLLHIDAPRLTTPQPLAQTDGWTFGGVFLPNGSKLFMTYNGIEYWAKIHNGFIKFEGHIFKSLSGAAAAATEQTLNGWHYWYVRLPGENFVTLADELRPHRSTRKPPPVERA